MTGGSQKHKTTTATAIQKRHLGLFNLDRMETFNLSWNRHKCSCWAVPSELEITKKDILNYFPGFLYSRDKEPGCPGQIKRFIVGSTLSLGPSTQQRGLCLKCFHFNYPRPWSSPLNVLFSSNIQLLNAANRIIFTQSKFFKSDLSDCDADEPVPVDLSVPSPGLKRNINVVI